MVRLLQEHKVLLRRFSPLPSTFCYIVENCSATFREKRMDRFSTTFDELKSTIEYTCEHNIARAPDIQLYSLRGYGPNQDKN